MFSLPSLRRPKRVAEMVVPQRKAKVVPKRKRPQPRHKTVGLDATPLQFQELEAIAAANPQDPPSKKLAAARKRFVQTAGAKDAVDISARSPARDREVNRINRRRLVATAAQVIANHINPSNYPIDPSRWPTREPEPDPDFTDELNRALAHIDIDVEPQSDDDSDLPAPGLAAAAASSGGPGLAASAAAAVRRSSTAAAPARTSTSYTGQSPPPLPMPTANTRLRAPPQPQVERFDLYSDDEADGSGGARRASAKKALAQLLLHRSRK